MNKARKPRSIHRTQRSLRTTIALIVCGLLGFCASCLAQASDEPFYRQLIRFKDHGGYQPTRAFTVVTDARQGNRLVAEDDPDLNFNMAWMDQFQPGYKSRNGGAALGVLLRGYARSLFESYRGNNQGNSLIPNADDESLNFGGDVEYDLRLKSDEVLVGVKYTF